MVQLNPNSTTCSVPPLLRSLHAHLSWWSNKRSLSLSSSTRDSLRLVEGYNFQEDCCLVRNMTTQGRTFLVLLCLLCCASVGKAEYLKYKDHKQPVGVRIKDLMKRMNLKEKIGQMTQIERLVASPQVMKDNFIGSVLSGGGSVPAPQATAQDWVNMNNEFQKGALSTRLGIPMIYGIDAVHGHNNVFNATIFPHNVGLGATRDPKLVKRIGAATALEVRATGISYVFAPCIAVCRDPRWGRCYESYSEDHKIVQEMTEIIPGLQGDIPSNYKKGAPYVAGKDKVIACAKHFAGDGGTQYGIDENNTIIDHHGLFSIHMPAYYNSIIKGVSTVMVSYSSWNGVKMHANRDLVTGFLKNTLKFRGFVISDWQGIDKITTPAGANYTYSVQAGINAGIDMVMVPKNYTEFIDDLTALVEKNIIPMSRIDDAVRRILRVKFIMGLFENPLADLSFVDQLGKKEHRELAREAVRKSLVLLKNGKSANEPLLPLPKKASKILIAGGWTINGKELVETSQPALQSRMPSNLLLIPQPMWSTQRTQIPALSKIITSLMPLPWSGNPHMLKCMGIASTSLLLLLLQAQSRLSVVQSSALLPSFLAGLS